MSTLKTNNIEHLDASTPSIQTTIGGGTILAGVSTVSGALNVGSGTSISSPATNELALGTNNTEKVRITSAGSVGIGTDNPARHLHVNGTSQFQDYIYGNSIHNKIYVNDDLALSTTKKLYFDSGSNTYIHEPSGDTLAIVTGGAERMRILSSGGITFNGDTAAANALDDYEEGVWSLTPTGGTWTVNRAYYIKIGRQVTVHFSGGITSPTGAAAYFILPYAVDASTSSGTHLGVESHGSCMIGTGTPPANTYNATVYCWSNYAAIYYSRIGASWSLAAGSNIGTSLQFTATYTTAT